MIVLRAGDKIGVVTLKYAEMRGKGKVKHCYWVCKCQCGEMCAKRASELRRQRSTVPISCGCEAVKVYRTLAEQARTKIDYSKNGGSQKRTHDPFAITQEEIRRRCREIRIEKGDWVGD